MKPLWDEAERRAEEKRIAALRARNLRADGVTVLSPCPGHSVTTEWGRKPKDNTYWQTRKRHTGDDYDGDLGDKLVAVLGGTAYHYWDKVLGEIVLLFADNGFTYWYCHVSRRTVYSGQRVEPNQKIAEVGQTGTGAKFGPHLHFEKRRGHTFSWAGEDLNPTW